MQPTNYNVPKAEMSRVFITIQTFFLSVGDKK